LYSPIPTNRKPSETPTYLPLNPSSFYTSVR